MKNEIGGFWIGSFIAELWRDLCLVAHLDNCFSLSRVHRKATYLQQTAFQLVVPSVPKADNELS